MDSPRPDPPGTAQWYYTYGGDSHGPITSSELRNLVASGQLPADTLVWREGMHAWLPASDLGLTAVPAAPVPPPVAAPLSRLPVSRLPVSHASPSGMSGPVSEAVGGRARQRRGATPRGSAKAKRWAWTISAALLLLVLGFAIGHVIQSRSGKPTAGAGTVDPGRLGIETTRDRSAAASDSRRIPATPPRSEPQRGSGETGDDSHASTQAPAVASAPFRTTELPAEMGVKGTADGKVAEPSETNSLTDPEGLVDGPPGVLYQEILIHRRPSFGVLTATMTQDIQYMILSKLALQPRLDDGSFRVTQEVLSTRLDRADEMSRGTYDAALKKLKGKRFIFTLNAKSEVVNFDGYEPELTAAPVEHSGSTGYQMTNVLDKDGWKELIQLSFLEPAKHIAPGQNWTRQMAHDWSPLGSWAGVTTFSQDTAQSPPLLHFNYTHEMTYTPSASADSALPFRVSDAEFRLINASGRFVYDPVAQYVTQVDESFHVKGTVGTELLGESAKIQIEEHQQVTIKLTTQK